MKLLILALLAITSFMAQAQVRVVRLDKAAIPKSIGYKGHIINAVKYYDNNGEHLVITSETGILYSRDSYGKDLKEAKLYAYDYKLAGLQYRLYWKLNDIIEPCEYDVTATYLPNTFAVTDLNKDGVAEVWLMYKTTCTSDVSPLTLKIIMYQGHKKHAMRGETKVKLPGEPPYGGEIYFR